MLCPRSGSNRRLPVATSKRSLRALYACSTAELFHSAVLQFWALGAVVSASRLHRVGRGFESLSAHHFQLRESGLPVVCRKPGLYYEVWRRLEALPGVSHDCPMSLPCVSPVNFIGLAYATEAPAACPKAGHRSPAQPQILSSTSALRTTYGLIRSRMRVFPSSILHPLSRLAAA